MVLQILANRRAIDYRPYPDRFQMVQLWHVASGKPLFPLIGHEGQVWGVTFPIESTESGRAAKTPPGRMHFAYTGSPEPGQAYTYRVYAPEFVVEFLNVQADAARNPANHIHSAWRNVKGDFGLAP